MGRRTRPCGPQHLALRAKLCCLIRWAHGDWLLSLGIGFSNADCLCKRRGVRKGAGVEGRVEISCLVFCLVLSCLVLSCLVLSCLVLSCIVLSCLVLSCLVLACLVLSCLVLLWLRRFVVSCPALSCPVPSCRVVVSCRRSLSELIEKKQFTYIFALKW
jgi:hypothetical protein